MRTLILPYYENPGMLREQFAAIACWPVETKKQWRLIVVDDGSPTSPAEPVFKAWGKTPIASSLYRIKVDVRWNWIACRNLAAFQCGTDFFLMTDIDHIVPARTAWKLARNEFSEATAYRFNRVSAPDLTPYHPHPNSWFMSRALFDRVGGYDERFSGGYGTDKEFWNRVQARSPGGIVMLEHVLIRVGREVIPDASTTTYERKTKFDAERKAQVRAMIARDPRPLRLSFPWERLI